MIYTLGLVAIYLNALLTFHLMPVVQETAHPNLYAMLIFPLSGLLMLWALFGAYARLTKVSLSVAAGHLHAQARSVATVFALNAAISVSLAGFGLPTGLVAGLSVLAFMLTFFVARSVLK